MTMRTFAALVAALTLSSAACAAPWEIWTSPQALAALDARGQVLEVSSRCPDGCRYDRSNAGPEAPAANPYPLRWIYQDGAEAVIFDQRGAGAVTRFWLTSGDGVARCINPATRVRFYVDGAITPTLDRPLAELFDGSAAPFTPPLVADRHASAGGYVSRVPIAYQHSLRIALLNWQNGSNPCVAAASNGWNPLWYQIQFHRLPADSVASSFSTTDSFAAFRDFLGHAGDDPWHGLLAPTPITATVAPAGSITLAAQGGSGWLRGIRLVLPPAQRANVRLRITVDGDTTVDLPLADFFASAASAEIDARSVLTGVDSGGGLYAWWPMPYRQSLTVQLVADVALASPVAVTGALFFDAAAVPAAAGRFRAQLTDQCVSGGDMLLFQAGGAGKLVGIAARQRANGLVHPGYLEGDERAYADGAITPIWYGTGVEDLYDGGFYFNDGVVGFGGFAQPLAGASEVDRTGAAVTATHRLLLTDPLGYANGLRLTQEAGDSPFPNGGVPTCLRQVTYAYTQPQPLAVSYQRLDIGTLSALAHDYSAIGATCSTVTARYDDEPATTATRTVCRGNGSRRFRFVVDATDQPLRLRRSHDAGGGSIGVLAGSGAAQILVNGNPAGWFSPSAADTVRRWQQQDAALSLLVPASGILDMEIIPDSSMTSADYSDAGYELIGGWRDAIFRHGFDAVGVAGRPASGD